MVKEISIQIRSRPSFHVRFQYSVFTKLCRMNTSYEPKIRVSIKYPHICQSCCLQIFHPCFASSLCRSCELSHSMYVFMLPQFCTSYLCQSAWAGKKTGRTDCSSNISTEQNNVNLPKYRRKKIPGKNTSPKSLQMDICSQRFNDAIHPSVIQKEVKKLKKKIQGSISE